MQAQSLEDRLLKHISLQSNKHCLTQRLAKNAVQYGFRSLSPTQQNLLKSLFRCHCENCKKTLVKTDLLEAYQEEEKFQKVLCENCRTILQTMG